MTFEEFFDRRVPLALALGLLLQAGGIVWWASARDADLFFQQRRIAQLEESANGERQAQTEVLQRLARIEERVTAEAATMERLEQLHNGNTRR